MAPSLRDAIKADLMSLLGIKPQIARADRCVKRKLVDHLFNPETYSKSPDKLLHEEPGRQGAKRGGYYFWLIRQVRRLAEPTTPEWYGSLTYTRERYDTACMTAYAQVLLQRFPVFDGAFAYDAPEQSDAFRAFDKRMQDVRADLGKLRALLPKVSRKSKMKGINIMPDGGGGGGGSSASGVPPPKRVCLGDAQEANDVEVATTASGVHMAPVVSPVASPGPSPVPTEGTELQPEGQGTLYDDEQVALLDDDDIFNVLLNVDGELKSDPHDLLTSLTELTNDSNATSPHTPYFAPVESADPYQSCSGSSEALLGEYCNLSAAEAPPSAPMFRSLGSGGSHAAAARAPALSREGWIRHLVACAAMCGDGEEEEE